jgi:hypothetical protein
MFRSNLITVPPNWLRALLACLALVFMLDTVAHAAHSHDDATSGPHAQAHLCAYCAGFGGLTDAPVPARLASQPAQHSVLLFPPELLISYDLPVASRSRAPPSF